MTTASTASPSHVVVEEASAAAGFFGFGAPVCGWCDPADPHGPAEVLIVWQHEPDVDLLTGRGCWCEVVPGNERRHISHACAAHARRERQDLRELGFTVVPWVATREQTGRVA